MVLIRLSQRPVATRIGGTSRALPLADRPFGLRPGLDLVRHLSRPARILRPDHLREARLLGRPQFLGNSPIPTSLDVVDFEISLMKDLGVKVKALRL